MAIVEDETLSKKAFYALLLYDAAKRSKRKNIIIFLSEGSFRGNTKYGFVAVSDIFRERKIDCEVVWLGGEVDRKAITGAGYKAIVWDKTWKAADKTLHSKAIVYGNFDWVSEKSYERQLCTAGARRIYLGHGVPAKHIGYSQIGTRGNIYSFTGMVHETLGYTDVVSESTELESTLHAAFPSADIHALGSVRNDIFSNTDDLRPIFMHGLSPKNYLAVRNARRSGRKIVLYAPTYREKGQRLDAFINSVKRFYARMADHPDWLLVVKYHPGFKRYASSDVADLYHPRAGILLLDDKEDVQPYLRETDVLITDYSSIYYDYLLLDRPVVFFQPDRAEYEKARKRNFYSIEDRLNIGPIVDKPESVQATVSRQLENRAAYSADRNTFARFLHQYGNDGMSGRRLADFLASLL